MTDIFKKLARGPQIVLPKDAGFIVAKTGLNRKMRALDAGAGSGFLAIHLAAAAKEVVTYEKDARWQKLAAKNFKTAAVAGIENIRLKKGDVKKAREKASSFDVVTFDFADSWKRAAIAKAKKFLRSGGWLVLYYPTIGQVELAIKELARQKFGNVQVDEIIQRRWQPSPLRPETKQLSHTGFLVFARRQ